MGNNNVIGNGNNDIGNNDISNNNIGSKNNCICNPLYTAKYSSIREFIMINDVLIYKSSNTTFTLQTIISNNAEGGMDTRKIS